MNLREYLDKENLTIQMFANDMNISWTYAWRIVKGLSNPSAMLSAQIHEWTKKKVKICNIRKCTRHCANNCECSKK